MNNKELSIKPSDKEILTSLLKHYLPDTSVWVFGSRISNNAKPWSDLDMVVFTNKEQRTQLSLLKEAFEESNLSFRVDLQEWNLLPENFKSNIKMSYIQFR